MSTRTRAHYPTKLRMRFWKTVASSSCNSLDKKHKSLSAIVNTTSFSLEESVMQNMSNSSVVLYGKEDLKIEDRPLKGMLSPQDVKLEIKSVGICGTDLHLYEDGGIGDFQGETILGHEASGVVTEVGSNVKHLKTGDRVAMEPHVGCTRCWKCKEGCYNICFTKIHGIPATDGYLTQQMFHRADTCHKLPDNVSDDEGAFIEPLAVAVHACKKARFKMGSTVLICGAGTVGLLTLMTTKAAGASTTTVIDLSQSRLELAKSLGADHTVQTMPDMSSEETAKVISETMGGPPKVAFECSGSEMCVQTSIHAVSQMGTVVLVGFGADTMTIPMPTALLKEMNIVSSLASANCFPAAIALVANGQINVKALITHRYKMDQISEALTNVKNRIGIKSIINI